jgi:hypothetical protein
VNEFLRYAGDYAIVLAAIYAVRRDLRKHVGYLRDQLSDRGVQDAWDVRCSRCRRRIRDADHLRLIGESDGHPDGIVRAWHSDNPKCAAAAATDRDAMTVFMGIGK